MRVPSTSRAPGTISIAAIVLIALAGAGCSLQREGHEWIRQRPPEAFNAKWEELPASRVYEVAPELREAAVALLKAESGRLATEDEFRRFVPAGVSVPGGRWYLLRAVRSPDNDGAFHLLTRGRDVAVTYRTSSRRNETVKSALVAQLDDSPANIFVEISVR